MLKIIRVDYNFQQQSARNMISKVAFCEKWGISESALSSLVAKNLAPGATTQGYIDENYFLEFDEAKRALINYAHDIYYAITYAYDVPQYTLSKWLAERTKNSVETWNTYLTYHLFRIDEKTIINMDLSQLLLMFFKLASKYLHNLSKTKSVINNY